MAVTFPNLSTEAGLKHLDEYLLSRTFITGHQATRDDITVYGAISKVPGPNFPNVSRWYNHISALLASSFPGEAIGVEIEGAAPACAPVAETTTESPPKDEEDDDDLDLFGEETEEEKKAAAEREASKKASSKKKESGKSSVLLDVKPWDDETDMKKLEEIVRSVQMPGLFWGASKLIAVGYGIKKLQIMMTIEDDLVSVDDLIEDQLTSEPANEYIQSCDIAAFNKI